MTDIDLRAPRGKLFLGGTWRDAVNGGLAAVENPADESEVAQIAWGDVADIDAAAAAAVEAAPAWAATSWMERAAALRQVAVRLRDAGPRLALIDTVDSGNPIAGSLADVQIAAGTLEYFAGVAGQARGETIPGRSGTFTFTQRKPYGVVGRILAYNHPLLFAVQGFAAALVTGNTVILKPADVAALSALEVAALVEDLFPPGVLQVVPGSGQGAGHALVADPRVPRIAFTGSVATGRRVLETAAHHIKHVTLELGGKNPLIVFPQADIDAVADAAVLGMNLTRTNGQSCQSTSRILVHADAHDALVEAIASRFDALRVGPPEDEENHVGPLAFRAHYERVLGFIEGARREGATLVSGGERPAGLERGYYVRPTLFSDVTPDMTLAREEVFGPVLAVMRWTDPDDMLAIANGTEYGLTANVWSGDLATVLGTVDRLEAGMVWVNGPGPRPPGTPFGGFKHSGLGRETGMEELLSYTQEQSVIVRY